MAKRIIGYLFVAHPFLILLLTISFRLDHIWYLSENFKVYDLIYAVISFIIFCSGILLLQKRRSYNLIILLTTSFIVYQVLFWNLTYPRYLSQVKLTESSDLMISPYDGGAFTASSVVKLEISNKYGIFFRKHTSIKSYKNIRTGKLLLEDDQLVRLELETYSNEKWHDLVNIKEALKDSSY